VFTSASFGPSDTLFFVDGLDPGRVRYMGPDGLVRTVLGTLPFYGVGLDRRVIRTRFGGVAYKSTQAGAWDAPGLYFIARQAPTLGRIGSDDLAVALWGNQSRTANLLVGSMPVSPTGTMGDPAYPQCLAFDAGSRLVLRSEVRMFAIDKDGTLSSLQSTSTEWDEVPDGANPALNGLYAYGGYSNVTTRGGASSLPALFFLGALRTLVGLVNYPVLKLFDFSSPTGVRKLLGDGTTGGPSAPTSGTDVSSLPIDDYCRTVGCYTQYDAGTDRLYFSEHALLRYISPTTPPFPTTLANVLDATPYQMRNFIFTLDGNQVYFVAAGGASPGLHCMNAPGGSSPRASCNNTALGPPPSLGTLVDGPNQLTWLDANTLLVSDYQYTIYEYTLEP
jgi:hypothetical protein